MRHPSLGTLALAACLTASPASAAPLPELALPAARHAALPSAAFPVPDASLGVCGTRFGAAADAIARDAERTDALAQPTSHSTDANGIAVLEDDGTFFYYTPSSQPELDIAAVGRAFYRTHGDDYDFLVVYLATGMDQWLGSANALAAAWALRNNTTGLGLPLFDFGASVGSAARLQSLLTMNGLGKYPNDPDAEIGGAAETFTTMDVIDHEFGHRWLAYTLVDSLGTPTTGLLGRDHQHWNFFFDTDSSFMEGCDWSRPAPDSFYSVGAHSTFGALDQYLMGLRTRAEMDSFFVINAPSAFNPPGTYFPGAGPQVGIGMRGHATWWKLEDLEAANGVRTPEASSAPHQWRVAFALVVPPGTDATAADLAKVQAIRSRFPQTIVEATGGRGSVDVSLDSHAGTVRIAHAPLPDVETAVPRAVGARVWIDQAGIPLTVDAGSVAAHWRAGSAGAFTTVALAPAAPDSFAGTLPALPPGTYEYWLSASSDSAGIDATLPAAGPVTPFAFTVGPDVTPPLVRHSPIAFQASDRLPQPLLARVTDNLGVDAVWLESSVDGGPLVTTPISSAGGDSFVVAVGSGLSVGQSLAYRFVARDASLAANLGYSNAAFDTLHVSRDMFDDFENPSDWTHSGVLWLWRDAWMLDSSDSSPPGGTSWHCGNAGGIAYPPHVDAALVSPNLYYPAPGLTFSFDERHDLEQASPTYAYDAVRVEVQNASDPWTAVTPTPPYTHVMRFGGMPFSQGSACWSGKSNGWVTRTVDLGSFSPGPLRVRIRMCSDDLVSCGGVWVDRVRVHFPGSGALGVPTPPLEAAAGPAWPSPSSGPLHLSLALPRGARVEWTLHDVQGRRVATLWSGEAAAGRSELAGHAPEALPAGLYFSRVRIGARTLGASRLVLAR